MGITLWAVLIIFGAQYVSSQKGCPIRCTSCSNGVAECSKRSLVTPPTDFPEGTYDINLDNNHLRVLGTNSFQRLNSVRVLRLKGNKLRVIKTPAFKSFPSLVTLDLANNQLVKVYSKGFEGLNKLQTLSLQYNSIYSLEDAFDLTPRLYQLNMAFNSLQTIGKNDLKTPTRLHYLDLRNNKIRRVHPEAFVRLIYLRYIFLNGNPLVKVPDLIFGSNVLQMVDFSNCKLVQVPRQMPQSVSDFRLSDNQIMQINDTDFMNITNLRMLAINNNQLHFVANGAFKNLTKLEEIWLRNNRLVYIPRGLPDNLLKLYMDTNTIQEIEEGLFTHSSRLEYLTIENNQIQKISHNTFSELKFLKTLNFRGNLIKIIESDTFDSLHNLTMLTLSDNPLEKIEAGGFRNLDNLTSLHLSMCGETTLIEKNFLTEMPRLKYLGLMNSPGAAKSLLKLIEEAPAQVHPLVKELDLTYNDLQTLTPRLQNAFPAITSLFLDGNPWICDKRLVWLKEWMSTTPINFWKHDEPVCEKPNSLKGQLIKDSDSQKFVDVITQSTNAEVVLTDTAQPVADAAAVESSQEAIHAMSDSKAGKRQRKNQQRGKGRGPKKEKKKTENTSEKQDNKKKKKTENTSEKQENIETKNNENNSEMQENTEKKKTENISEKQENKEKTPPENTKEKQENKEKKKTENTREKQESKKKVTNYGTKPERRNKEKSKEQKQKEESKTTTTLSPLI